MNIAEFILPTSWASYLINRDESGYDSEELAIIKQWESEVHLSDALSCNEDSYFTRYGDAATVLDMALVECTEYQFPA